MILEQKPLAWGDECPKCGRKGELCHGPYGGSPGCPMRMPYRIHTNDEVPAVPAQQQPAPAGPFTCEMPKLLDRSQQIIDTIHRWAYESDLRTHVADLLADLANEAVQSENAALAQRVRELEAELDRILAPPGPYTAASDKVRKVVADMANNGGHYLPIHRDALQVLATALNAAEQEGYARAMRETAMKSVQEGMPPKNQVFLLRMRVHAGSRYVRGLWNGLEWRDDAGNYLHQDITHYMPIPPLPEGGAE